MKGLRIIVPKEREIVFEEFEIELSIYTGIDPEVNVHTSWCHYPFKPGYIGEEDSIIRAGNTVDKSFFVKVPSKIDLKLVPITKFGTIALTSLRVSSFDSGDKVLIVGLGLVGNLAAQLFKIAGGKVIGVDLSKRRIERAKRSGIMEFTNHEGVDIAIDAVGDSRIVIEISEFVKDMGEIILLGTSRRSYETDITPLL
ncbi:MAG: zinc-binding dehydrogenase [Caldanaerobacter sp.]